MASLTIFIPSPTTLVISGEGLTVEVRTNSSGMASETIDPDCDEFAANEEHGHVDSSAERASSAVEVGATNSPDGATGRLDDLGSVQDGLKMSTDGQPNAGLSSACIERPIEEGVTGGESAAIKSHSSRRSSPVTDKAGEAFLPQAPRQPPIPFRLSPLPKRPERRSHNSSSLRSPLSPSRPLSSRSVSFAPGVVIPTTPRCVAGTADAFAGTAQSKARQRHELR